VTPVFSFTLLLATFASNAQPGFTFPVLLPPRKEFPPTFLEANGVTLALFAIAVLVLIVGLRLLRRRAISRAQISPENEARTALEALRQVPTSRETLGRVSQILRRYCAIAFTETRAELTTSELELLLHQSNSHRPEQSAQVIAFLRECDKTKFTPEPMPEQRAFLVRAIELLENISQPASQKRAA
jgi:hypothetical protein